MCSYFVLGSCIVDDSESQVNQFIWSKSLPTCSGVLPFFCVVAASTVWISMNLHEWHWKTSMTTRMMKLHQVQYVGFSGKFSTMTWATPLNDHSIGWRSPPKKINKMINCTSIPEQLKKGPWLFSVHIGTILSSYVGIISYNHDIRIPFFSPTSISWKVSVLFFVGSPGFLGHTPWIVVGLTRWG